MLANISYDLPLVALSGKGMFPNKEIAICGGIVPFSDELGYSWIRNYPHGYSYCQVQTISA
jgi:hypothetical protein